MSASSPRDEPQRLADLSSYAVLEAEREFDELTALAAQIFETPIALISLIDGCRQWFKARIGTDLAETPRDHSFCAFTLDREEPLIVPDAIRDPRFAENPLVTGEPRIRFYAGAPLVTPGGQVLGTLCVIDHVPRTPTPAQIHTLETLARAVMTRLELRRNLASLRESELAQRRTAESQTSVINALPAHIALIDEQGVILSVNESWRRFASANGLPNEESSVGRNYLQACESAVGDDSPQAAQVAAALRGVLTGRLPFFTNEYPCDTTAGTRWFRLMATPLDEHRRAGAVVMHIDITERKEAEEQAARNQALLGIATRSAKLGGWTMQATGQVLEWSDELRAIHEVPPGFTPTLDEGLAFYQPEHRERVRHLVAACLRDGTPFDAEFPIITAKANPIWVRALGEAVRDSSGAITRIQGAVQDISRRKHAEEQHRRLAERLTRTLESITDGFFTLGRDWRFTYFNSEAERMVRLSRSEILGKTIWEVFPEILGTTFEHEYRRALEEGVTSTFEEHFPPLDKWFQVRVYPSDQGLAVYFLDVTEARRSREVLGASEERFRTLVETAPEAIFIQTGGCFAYVNAAAMRLYGAGRPGQLVGRPVAEFCPRSNGR